MRNLTDGTIEVVAVVHVNKTVMGTKTTAATEHDWNSTTTKAIRTKQSMANPSDLRKSTDGTVEVIAVVHVR